MEETLGFVQAVKNVVIDPSTASIWPLFLSSFLNDLVGIFPYALALAGQLLFLKGTFTVALMAKLLVFVAVPVGLGSAFGSLPLYAAAYFGGKPAINKFQKFLRFKWEDVEKINARFKGTWYDDAIFLLLRCTPVLPSFPLDVAGGVLRMGFWPFFVLTAVGSIIRMMVTLVVVGMSMHSLSQF
jgi:membrane protein DedA with SNARE-associated domain